MEQGAVDSIVRGTVITSAVCGFVSGLYGISRQSPHYGLLAAAAAVNSGVTAVTFFTLREFAISPLLVHTLSWPQYARRRHTLGVFHASDPPLVPPTYSDVRMHKTLDTGLSGAIAGGVLRGWKSGPRSILPGALTIGALCTLLQLAYNEVDVTRLRYVSGIKTSTSVAPEVPPPVTSKLVSIGGFLRFLGLHQVTDEEYIKKMKITRDAHLKRIAELELQLAEETAKEANKSS